MDTHTRSRHYAVTSLFLFYFVPYSVCDQPLALTEYLYTGSFWDRQFLLPPPAPTILTARLRGV